jgi:hypothetical protein
MSLVQALAEAIAEVERLRTEADEMRRWAEEAAHAENLNARDAQKEREAVVAWLRESSDGLALLSPEGSATLRGAANEIERGDHRKGEP